MPLHEGTEKERRKVKNCQKTDFKAVKSQTSNTTVMGGMSGDKGLSKAWSDA